MKKSLLICFVLVSLVGVSTRSHAQLRIGVNVNIGAQPEWGPAGYNDAQYYYLPDVECYYNVPQRQFVYLSNGRWTFSAALPSSYSGYDLYSGYKVVINRPYAYNYFSNDRVRYAGYRNYFGRQECRDGRYYERGRNRDYDDHRGHGYDRHDRYNDHDNGWHGRSRENGHSKHHGRRG